MAHSDFTVFNLITRVHAQLHRFAEEHLFELGASPFEQWLLEEIPLDGRTSASELAQRLEVPTSTVTRALRRMEKWDYVELHKGYVLDARVLCSRRTALGTEVRDDCLGFEKEIDGLVLANVRPTILGGLIAGLRDMLSELQRLEKDRETPGGGISSGIPT